jgi:O-antigen ligase
MLERIYLVFSLLYFAGGLTPSDLAETQRSHAIDRANSLLQLVVFPVLILLFARNWKKLSGTLHSFALPLLFSALTVCSILWSTAPGFTMRRSVIMLGLTVFSLYIGARFSLPEQISLFGWMTVVFVLSSYILALVKPEWALSTGYHWGAWKGVFGHKNTLGRMALFGAIVLFTGHPLGVPKVLRHVAAWGSLGLIVLSGSLTSLMAAGFLASLWPVLPILKLKPRNTVPLWLAFLPMAAFIGVAIIANFGSLLQSVGRDPTLTGRTTLWNAIINVASRRQILGFGYSAFWHYDGPERAALFSQVGWHPPHAHNSYLDMWLDLGYPGLALLAYMLVSLFLKAAKLYRVSSSRSAGFPLMFILYLVTVNCTESDLFRTHSFQWAPCVAIYTSLRLLEKRAKRSSDMPRREPVLPSEASAMMTGLRVYSN